VDTLVAPVLARIDDIKRAGPQNVLEAMALSAVTASQPLTPAEVRNSHCSFFCLTLSLSVTLCLFLCLSFILIIETKDCV